MPQSTWALSFSGTCTPQSQPAALWRMIYITSLGRVKVKYVTRLILKKERWLTCLWVRLVKCQVLGTVSLSAVFGLFSLSVFSLWPSHACSLLDLACFGVNMKQSDKMGKQLTLLTCRIWTVYSYSSVTESSCPKEFQSTSRWYYICWRTLSLNQFFPTWKKSLVWELHHWTLLICNSWVRGPRNHKMSSQCHHFYKTVDHFTESSKMNYNH